MTKYLLLGMGIWCLYHAWRGIVPAAGAKHEVGRRMPVSTRFIFWLGRTVLTGFGFILWRYGK
jgi:hypothetical protein